MKLGEGLDLNNKKKFSKAEEKFIEQIQESVFNYLSDNINELPDNIKETIISLQEEILEGNKSLELKDIKIQQFIIRFSGGDHKRINLVVSVGKEKTKSLSVIVDKNTGEIKNLIVSDKYSKSLGELKDRNDDNILIRKEEKTKFKGVPIKEQEKGETDEDFMNRLFEEMVYNTWNGIFLENKKELKQIENSYKNQDLKDTRKNRKGINNRKITNKFSEEKKEKIKSKIIMKNAIKIANLIKVLQGTVDITSGIYKDVVDYFVHFLEKSPNLDEFPKNIKFNKIEDGLIVANGDYNFQMDGEDDGRKIRMILPAHFSFVFEKQKDGSRIIDGLHSYTD